MARIWRPIALLLPVALLATTLVPTTGMAAVSSAALPTHGTGAGVVQSSRPGTGEAPSGDGGPSVSIVEEPSVIALVPGDQLGLTAQVQPGALGLLTGPTTFDWEVSPASLGTIASQGDAEVVFQAGSVSEPAVAIVQVTCYGWYLEAGYMVPFSASASISLSIVPPLTVGSLSVSPDPASPGAPVSLTFSLSGGEPPLTLLVDFGDGSNFSRTVASSGTETFTHAYAAGTYDPTARVEDAVGEVVTSSSAAALLVTARLGASILLPAGADQGTLVNLQASVGGGSPPYSYSWSDSWGDSGPTGQNWSWVPTRSGTDVVSLQVTDAAGEEVEASSVDLHVASAPTLTLSSRQEVADAGTPFPLQLSLSGGTAPFNVVWTPGTGAPSLSSEFAEDGTYSEPYTFSSPGSVWSSGELTDATGTSYSVTADLGSIVAPPSVEVLASPSDPVAGQTIVLTATLTGGLPGYSWDWEFEGPIATSSALSGTLGAAGTVTWTGTTAGAETLGVTLQVVDASGGWSEGSTALVVDAPLLSSLSVQPTLAEVGMAATATAEVLGGDPPYQLALSVSDGESATGVLAQPGSLSIALLPRSAGNLSVVLRVTDAEGRLDIANATLRTSPALRLELSVGADPVDAGVNDPVTVLVRGGWAPYSGELSISDGQVLPFQGLGTSYAFAVPCAQPGTLSLVAHLSDTVGALAVGSQSLVVDPDPVATLAFATAQADAGVPIAYQAQASGGTGTFTSYDVSFGDGNSSTSPSGSHVYAHAGVYLANATVIDSSGHVGSGPSVTLQVAPPPSAVAEHLEVGADVGVGTAFAGEVQFGTSPYSYLWQFGDGSESTLADPTHAYGVAGLYRVDLTVVDALGASVTAPVLNVTVSPDPELSLEVNRSSLEATVPAELSAGVLGGAPPWTVTWSLGDGSVGTGSHLNHSYAIPGTYEVVATLDDGAGTSTSASLSVVVVPALDLGAVSIPAGGAEVGISSTLSASATGGVAPFRFVWEAGPWQGAGTGLADWAVSPNSSGTFVGSLEVVDAEGATAWDSFVLPVAPALSVNLSADPATPEVALPFQLLVTSQGGDSPLSIAWSVPSGWNDPSNGSVASEVVEEPGRYALAVVVTDAEGEEARAELALTVAPTLFLLGVAPTLHADAGVPVDLPLTFGGGVGTVTATVETPFGVEDLEGASWSVPEPGTYPLRILLTDQDGVTLSAVTNLTVDPAPVASWVENHAQAAVGATLTWKVSLAGGTGPFSSLWSVAGGSETIGPMANLSFASPGTYAVAFTSTDSAGGSVRLLTNVTVVPDSLSLKVNTTSLDGLAPFHPLLVIEGNGGQGALTVSVLLDDEPLAPASPLQSGLPWTLPVDLGAPGVYPVQVELQDALGAEVNTSFSWSVLAPLDPLEVAADPDAVAGLPLSLQAGWGAGNMTPIPGEEIALHWWGPDVEVAGPGGAVFESNRSGLDVVQLSATAQDGSGSVLENETVPVPVTVIPAAPARTVISGGEPTLPAGENDTVEVAVEDAFGNLETTYVGNVSCRQVAPASAPETLQQSEILGGLGSLDVSSTRAGPATYALSLPFPGSPGFSVVWTGNAARSVLRVVSWERAGSALFLNVSVEDVYGNPLSNISVTASVPGGATATGTAVDGNVSLVLPGSASASNVELTGPDGAVTEVALPTPSGPASDLDSLLTVAVFSGALLGVGLFLTVRRRRPSKVVGGRSKTPDAHDPDEARGVVEDILERLPGEDRDSVFLLASEHGLSKEEIETALRDLEREQRAVRRNDDEGAERWELALRPSEAGSSVGGPGNGGTPSSGGTARPLPVPPGGSP